MFEINDISQKKIKFSLKNHYKEFKKDYLQDAGIMICHSENEETFTRLIEAFNKLILSEMVYIESAPSLSIINKDDIRTILAPIKYDGLPMGIRMGNKSLFFFSSCILTMEENEIERLYKKAALEASVTATQISVEKTKKVYSDSKIFNKNAKQYVMESGVRLSICGYDLQMKVSSYDNCMRFVEAVRAYVSLTVDKAYMFLKDYDATKKLEGGKIVEDHTTLNESMNSENELNIQKDDSKETTKKSFFGGIIDKFTARGEDKNDNNSETSEMKDELALAAEKTAQIVEKNINNNSLSNLNDELSSLSISKLEREQYVFPVEKNSVYGINIFWGVIFVVISFYFAFISLGVLFLSNNFDEFGLIGTIGSLFIILCGVLLIIKSIRNIKYNNRYRKYEAILKYKNVQLVDDLEEYCKVEFEQVVKDLKYATEKKYIPQGHFGTGNLIFFTSDEFYNKYLEKKSVYDRYYRKQIEDRKRMKERTKEIEEILESGQHYIERIHESNDIIKDKEISVKLDRMEAVVQMIFHEVDINPSKANSLGLFLNYYLPTTEKLLGAYIDLDEKEIKGKSLKRAKQDIENSLDTINQAYENILDKFYETQELDIASDIAAMETLMKQESLTEK